MPTTSDAQGYLVRVPPNGSPTKVQYQSIVSGAPAAGDQCPFSYSAGQIPSGTNAPAVMTVPTERG